MRPQLTHTNTEQKGMAYAIYHDNFLQSIWFDVALKRTPRFIFIFFQTSK